MRHRIMEAIGCRPTVDCHGWLGRRCFTDERHQRVGRPRAENLLASTTVADGIAAHTLLPTRSMVARRERDLGGDDVATGQLRIRGMMRILGLDRFAAMSPNRAQRMSSMPTIPSDHRPRPGAPRRARAALTTVRQRLGAAIAVLLVPVLTTCGPLRPSREPRQAEASATVPEEALVQRVDHLTLIVDRPEDAIELFTRLGLPVASPFIRAEFAPEFTFESASFVAGNMLLEVVRRKPVFGKLETSLCLLTRQDGAATSAALTRLDVAHFEPLPLDLCTPLFGYDEDDGTMLAQLNQRMASDGCLCSEDKKCRWFTSVKEGLEPQFSTEFELYVNSYEFGWAELLAHAEDEMRRSGGGPLGWLGVRVIEFSSDDVDVDRARYDVLFGQQDEIAFHFKHGEARGVSGLVVVVASLERAVAFLEEQALPFERTPAGVVLRADALEGLSLTFVQG